MRGFFFATTRTKKFILLWPLDCTIVTGDVVASCSLKALQY